ncbi:MAG: hypothetical protein AAF628_04565 [Planctomycetota bacterium]
MRTPLPTLASCLLFAVPLAAQDTPPMPDNSATMAKLGWMVGNWVGEGAMQGYGDYTFRYELSWTMNKNFMKADYWMKVGGDVIWHDTGMLGWDKDQQKFVSFVFGIDGTIGGGAELDQTEVGVPADAQAFVIDGQTTGNSPWKKFRTVIVKIDDDTLSIDTLTLQGEKWVSLDKTTAKREKTAEKANDNAATSQPTSAGADKD